MPNLTLTVVPRDPGGPRPSPTERPKLRLTAATKEDMDSLIRGRGGLMGRFTSNGLLNKLNAKFRNEQQHVVYPIDGDQFTRRLPTDKFIDIRINQGIIFNDVLEWLGAACGFDITFDAAITNDTGTGPVTQNLFNVPVPPPNPYGLPFGTSGIRQEPSRRPTRMSEIGPVWVDEEEPLGRIQPTRMSEIQPQRHGRVTLDLTRKLPTLREYVNSQSKEIQDSIVKAFITKVEDIQTKQETEDPEVCPLTHDDIIFKEGSDEKFIMILDQIKGKDKSVVHNFYFFKADDASIKYFEDEQKNPLNMQPIQTAIVIGTFSELKEAVNTITSDQNKNKNTKPH